MKKKRLSGYPARSGWTKLLRIMKLTAFLIFVLIFDVSASVYSQNSKISISIKDGTFKEILSRIEEQSEFRFFYQNEQICNVERKSIEVTNETVSELVSELLEGTGLSYKLIERNIIIFPTFGDNGGNTNQQSQEYHEIQQFLAISGKVTDLSGSPLPGVSVVIKGTTNGTVTNTDGEFSLSNIPNDATLQFSFVGMKTQEISIAGKTSINVVMEDDAIGIEEVVAIGYGTRKKGELTGSLASVKTDVFQNRPVLNTYDALQGRLPGVVIQKGSGAPGDNDYDIKIRGYSSINGNSPLVLIDGSPGSINTINTDDIESVVVLKDAAAAIYGARAGDGVILVTTKNPQKGEPTITYTSNVSIKSPKFRETLNTIEYATLMSEAQVNMGEDPIPESVFEKIRNKAPVDASIPHWGYNLAGYDVPALYTDVDRAGAIIQNAVQQRHTLSISGGGIKVVTAFR